MKIIIVPTTSHYNLQKRHHRVYSYPGLIYKRSGRIHYHWEQLKKAYYDLDVKL